MNSALPSDEDRDVAGLNPGEHLLIWTIRRLVVRRMLCPLIAQKFADICGDGRDEALQAFHTFFATVGIAARRQVSIGAAGWTELSHDERQILSIVQAAQDEDVHRLAALSCWFVRGKDQDEFMRVASDLATALKKCDLLIRGGSLDFGIVPVRRYGLRVVS